MRFLGSLVLAAVLVFGDLPSLFARHAEGISCGTSRENSQGRLFLHRQSARTRARLLAAPAAMPVARDVGDIALIDDADGVVSRLNQFDLDGMTLAFQPSGANAAQYRYSVGQGGYDAAAASGTALALDDDDTEAISLPFPFPYFGVVYTQAYVNSDGNLTFTTGDDSTSDRSVGRMAAGPPRISPFFDDLDASRTTGGVRVLSEAGRVVVSWVAVPEYSGAGGATQTFQVRLYPSGRVEFSYSGITTAIENAVTGISPGGLKGSTTLVDFRIDPSADYAGPVMELFSSVQTIDMAAVAQKFYETHDDAYDYLVVYNALDLRAMGNALAYEDTVRARASGYGVEPKDVGLEYGSASRLQAVLNLGPVSQYSADPLAKSFPGRPGDTALSILAHEAGHLFLAFVSVPDPQNPHSQPMLGYQGSHWSFLFNSDASFLEGEEILDGAGISARFITRNIVSKYGPFDQYLMGFRAPSEVQPGFAVLNGVSPTNTAIDPNRHPASGVQFNGDRLDITIDQLIQANGRRTPDHTVAQRRFRFAFLLIVPQGQTPSSAIAQIDKYRVDFSEYFATATERRAIAETSLRRSLKLSLYPAAGVLAGGEATATLSVENAPTEDLAIQLSAPNGAAAVPASITIPAGMTSASFKVSGAMPGVEEITAAPQGQAYETAFARIQVAAATGVQLSVVSGGAQASTGGNPLPKPVVVRLSDINSLPYPGARIVATATDGGSVSPAAAATDAQGQASFTWTPGPVSAAQLRLALEGAPSVAAVVSVGSSAPSVAVVQNAASYANGMAANSFGTIWGSNLAAGQTIAAPPDWPFTLGGVSVRLNGTALRLLYVSDNQINVYVPADAALGAGSVSVTAPSGALATAPVTISSAQPGIFSRAILRAGTGERADTVPAAAGDYIELYCNGLGPTQERGGYQWTVTVPTVLIGGVPAEVIYHGNSTYLGVSQVNVRVPSGLASGQQTVSLAINGIQSNTETIRVQ